MNEISQILAQGENSVFEGKPKYAPYFVSILLKSLLFTAFAGIFVGIFLKSIFWGTIVGVVVFMLCLIFGNMAYSRIYYMITEKRVIIQSGIIGRDFKSIDYDRIQNVSVQVGPLGVLFKVGTVKIFTGEIMATGGRNSSMQPKYDTFQYIDAPYDVLKKLQTQLSLRKEKLA